MPRFNQLFNKPDQEAQPNDELAAFNKFSQANKQNIQPDTSLNVANTFKDAYKGVGDLRAQAIDKIAEQTDLGRNIPEVGANEDYRNIAKTGLDMVLPDVTDAVPLGKASHAMFPLLGMAAKEGKLLKFPKQAEKTAEELMQGVRKAESADLKLGSNLVNKPVLKTAEEQAADKLPGAFGKVSTPEMGSNISHNEIMDFLNKSPSYTEHINNRNLFKTNPQAYADKKDYLINAAREFLKKQR